MELGMTEEKMRERVDECLKENFSVRGVYALRRVLGDLDSSEKDEEMLWGPWKKGDFDSTRALKDEFGTAINILRTVEGKYHIRNCRYILTKDGGVARHDGLKNIDPVEEGEATESLYAQVQQLLDEVRAYDAKRAQMLERIENLMTKIQQRKDCPAYFGKPKTVTQAIEVEGAAEQIRWPYRSQQVLQRLRLTKIDEIVDYFQNFDNFVTARNITLWEWWVITTILRQKGLLLQSDYPVHLDDEIDDLELSVRTYNCLKRAGIRDMDDLAVYFCYGMKDGWQEIGRVRNLGERSQEELKRRLSEVAVELSDTACFPTAESRVWTLDFDRVDRQKLWHYGLKTIGELAMACRDENRFRGLKYIDFRLYSDAVTQLRVYGFEVLL